MLWSHPGEAPEEGLAARNAEDELCSFGSNYATEFKEHLMDKHKNCFKDKEEVKKKYLLFPSLLLQSS